MRVIGGIVKGSKLKTLEGDNTRPTLDRVKESLYNIINFNILDSKILDLFSGSGSLAIEALSRGAEFAVLCDNNKTAIDIIEQNVKKTRFEAKCKIVKMDYRECLKELSKGNIKYDVIFLDPPYDSDFGIDSINKISDLDLLDKDGIIIFETDKYNIPDEIGIYKKYDARKYGKAMILFFAERG
jgi:RNA methyltransferase, RsmD family